MKYIGKTGMLALLLLTGCAKDETGTQTGSNEIAFEIGFAEDAKTRVATDAEFNSTWEDGDHIGVFAVKSGEELATSGNYIHNVALIYTETTPGDPATGTWTPLTPLYWPQDGSALDFYAYYPYVEAFDPTAAEFNVMLDQSGETDFNVNDWLKAKSNNNGAGYAKGATTVPLEFSHALAMIQTTLDNETGLLDTGGEITVTLKDVQRMFNLNLVAGEATATGDKSDITMHRVERPGTTEYETTFTYRALLPAGQTFAAGTSLMRITDGTTTLRSEPLTEPLTLMAGQAETFGQKMPSVPVAVTFTDGSTGTISANWPVDGVYEITFGGTGENIVYSVTLEGNTHLIGRKDNETVTLKLDADGNLQLREAVDDGSGTPKIPIGTYDELQMIGQTANLGGHYLQEADLDLLGAAELETTGFVRQNWTPIGTGANRFTGSYDGGGFRLANLYIDTSDIDEIGLFGIVGEGSSLSGIGIVSGSVTSTRNNVGGVCGWSAGDITDCYNMATVSGANYVGGVCGENTATITACYNTGPVSGTELNNVGGVCGSNSGGTITACYNAGTGTVTGNRGVGGVCGDNRTGSITACYNEAEVTGTMYVGGVCGVNSATITACYNTGAVSGTTGLNDVGGVCGRNLATIVACWFLDRSDGIGGIWQNEGSATVTAFGPDAGAGQWPTTDLTGWATGDGTTGYWKALSPNPLGDWVGTGDPAGIDSTFPKLWWEED